MPTRGVLQINDSPIWERGSGLISLHPHPVESEESSGLAMIITGTDDEGLELAARLFPIRTGVPVGLPCPSAERANGRYRTGPSHLQDLNGKVQGVSLVPGKSPFLVLQLRLTLGQVLEWRVGMERAHVLDRPIIALISCMHLESVLH